MVYEEEGSVDNLINLECRCSQASFGPELIHEEIWTLKPEDEPSRDSTIRAAP